MAVPCLVLYYIFMPKNSKKTQTNLTVDVAIIGGGLAGISCAYFLSKSGKSVAVLEQDKLGSGVTSLTTAFVTQVIDTNISDLVSMFGQAKTKLIWQSHQQAVDTIENVIHEESIECGFMRCSNYYYANSEKEFEVIKKDFSASKKLGFKVTLRGSDFLPFKNFGSMETLNQAKFSAGKYIQGLAKAAALSGAKIFENTKVVKISEEDGFSVAYTKEVKVTAKSLIIASYYPFGNPKITLFKKGMYVSYVLKLEIPKGALPEAIYEDTSNPYNYFRVDGNTLTIGGCDHRAEIKMSAEKNFKALEEYIKKTFPGLEYKIKTRWTGPILEPTDGLGLIGEVKPGRYVATAFSGNGMTYSTISGLLLTDLITKKPNSYKKLYDPKRIPSPKTLAIKAKDYTEEFFKGAVKNWFK
jgi:glycine/D-amino acid oxidase-like deaminating enzyme